MKALPVTPFHCGRCGKAISQTEARTFGLYIGDDRSGYTCLNCRINQRNQFRDIEIQINEDGRGRSCDICHKGLDQIEIDQGGKRQMVLHFRDGVLQYHCFRCSDAYEESNRRQFRDTLWGWARKLK